MAGYTSDVSTVGQTTFQRGVRGSTGGEARRVLERIKPLTYSAATNKLLLDVNASASESAVKESTIGEIEIVNTGSFPAFAILGYRAWTAEGTMSGNTYYFNYILKPGERMLLPDTPAIIQDEDNDQYDGTAIDNEAPDSNMHLDTGADVDHATSATMGSDATHTTLNLEDGHSKYFIIGDLIRIENEICEVTAVGTGADLANSTLTITRGAYGSTAATHADDVAVRLPFFNAHHDFDKYSVCQTDANGKLLVYNLFGKGRTSSGGKGVVAGSFSMKFYEAGYQTLGLSGITSQTNTGLTASTAYEFDIQVDGGTNFDNLTFTTDSSNVNWGGTNGVIQKIQTALDEQFYTSGNLFEKKVHVAIVDGDIRFTSGSHLSTSAIALTAGSTGAAEFFGTGRVPAVGSINSAVGAKLPDDVVYDNVTYETTPNYNALAYDDGFGNIKGVCTGTINYETGKLDIKNAPINSEFVYSVLVNSAFSGRMTEGEADRTNVLTDIYVNTPNQKAQGSVVLKEY